jgi:hypothetical protein
MTDLMVGRGCWMTCLDGWMVVMVLRVDGNDARRSSKWSSDVAKVTWHLLITFVRSRLFTDQHANLFWERATSTTTSSSVKFPFSPLSQPQQPTHPQPHTHPHHGSRLHRPTTRRSRKGRRQVQASSGDKAAADEERKGRVAGELASGTCAQTV